MHAVIILYRVFRQAIGLYFGGLIMVSPFGFKYVVPSVRKTGIRAGSTITLFMAAVIICGSNSVVCTKNFVSHLVLLFSNCVVFLALPLVHLHWFHYLSFVLHQLHASFLAISMLLCYYVLLLYSKYFPRTLCFFLSGYYFFFILMIPFWFFYLYFFHDDADLKLKQRTSHIYCNNSQSDQENPSIITEVIRLISMKYSDRTTGQALQAALIIN